MAKHLMKNILLGCKDTLNRRSIIKPHLEGGLCNKLFCLMSACEIAHKKNYRILEPIFGWESDILFSDIYDIDYFNRTMKEITGIEELMIHRNEYISPEKIQKRIIPLWKHSERNLKKYRKNNFIDNNSMMVNLLRCLKLNTQLQNKIINHTPNDLAIQFRIESDWVTYSQKKKVDDNEILLIDAEELINRLVNFNSRKNIFFTTGENQESIQSKLLHNGVKSSFFYDPSLEYEINAAVNFEILCQSNKFIGLSRSTFSNLITLKRQLILKNTENYIYNYGNEIHLRKDFGLYPSAFDSINKTPEIK